MSSSANSAAGSVSGRAVVVSPDPSQQASSAGMSSVGFSTPAASSSAAVASLCYACGGRLGRAHELAAVRDARATLSITETVIYRGQYTAMRRGVVQLELPPDAPVAQQQQQLAEAQAQAHNRRAPSGTITASEDGSVLSAATTTSTVAGSTMPAAATAAAAAAPCACPGAPAPRAFRVLVKTVSESGGALAGEAAARLRYEHRAFQRVSEAAAVQCWAPLGLRRTEHGALALLFPDSGGELFSDWLRPSAATGSPATPAPARPLLSLLRAAIALTRTLHGLHSLGVVLHLLRPSAMLYSESTRTVQCLDFGRSSLLAEEDAQLSDGALRSLPISLLSYAAPECTGRANRLMDARSDLYSVGVCLFEMLQARCPFVSARDDALELVHMHLAAQPPPFVLPAEDARAPPLSATTLATDAAARPVLRVLELVVRKLLAKTPEDRFSSARGLLADLLWIERALLEHVDAAQRSTGLTEQGRAPTPWRSFRLAAFDLASSFRLSGKLYGRAVEVRTLMEAFDRVSGVRAPPRGRAIASELVLLAGFSGVGKTSIVEECQQLLVRSRAFFARAKFDLHRRNAAVLVQMFDGVLHTILASSSAEKARWRAELLAALAGNGGLLVSLLPLLVDVLGPQEPLPALSTSEREALFTATFLRFVAVFARPQHPLVLFVDDLQWADDQSLHLLHKLLVEGAPAKAAPGSTPDAGGVDANKGAAAADKEEAATADHSLLLIGAYRDNEVGPRHPLTRVLLQLRTWEALRLKEASKADGASSSSGGASAWPRLHELALKPLVLAHLSAFVQESFHCADGDATQLAQLLVHRCAGNPWFCRQVLQRLYESGLIRFEVAATTPPAGITSSSGVGGGSVDDGSELGLFERGRWTWNVQEVANAHLGGSVVELLVGNLSVLSESLRGLLQLAACLGHRFSLNQLQLITQRPAAALAAELWTLVQRGLVLPLGGIL